MCLALRASGLRLRYATLQNLIPSFPWIVPHTLHPGTIQGKEGIKFCHLTTLQGDHYHHNHTYPLKGQRGKKSKNNGVGNNYNKKSKSPLEHSDSYSYKRYTQL